MTVGFHVGVIDGIDETVECAFIRDDHEEQRVVTARGLREGNRSLQRHARGVDRCDILDDERFGSGLIGSQLFENFPDPVATRLAKEREHILDDHLGRGATEQQLSGRAEKLDAARLTRSVVRRLNWRKTGPAPIGAGREPLLDPEELIGIVPEDLKSPFDPKEIIYRFADESHFDEFKPLYGSSLMTGWAQIHGYPVGILANARGVLFSEEAQKATQFIQLANSSNTPLIFMHNTTGYMVGKEYEQGGIIKHGAQMINAVRRDVCPVHRLGENERSLNDALHVQR